MVFHLHQPHFASACGIHNCFMTTAGMSMRKSKRAENLYLRCRVLPSCTASLQTNWDSAIKLDKAPYFTMRKYTIACRSSKIPANCPDVLGNWHRFKCKAQRKRNIRKQTCRWWSRTYIAEACNETDSRRPGCTAVSVSSRLNTLVVVVVVSSHIV